MNSINTSKLQPLDNLSFQRCFIIAEAGNNHNGSFTNAKKLVDAAVESGADCVKFQMRNINDLYREKSIFKNGEDLGTEYIIDLLEKFELSIKQQKLLQEYCQKKGIEYMCTPWDQTSVEVLENFGVNLYKVASADLTNLALLDRLSSTQKLLIISTGMSTNDEIKTTANFLSKKSVKFALLHCNSTYPAPFEDINLRWMEQLKEYSEIVGYSGHERGIAVSIGAVALGAKILERHITLDRNQEGPDHAASLEPKDFKKLVTGVRELEISIGKDIKDRVLSQGELINRENLGKSLMAKRFLKKGTKISHEDILVKSPGQGLSPQKINNLIGSVLNRDINVEEFFYDTDLGEKLYKPKEYEFSRPWGIPVRYHDINKFCTTPSMDLVEFHFSYSDLDLSPDKYLQEKYELDFVVHAPELFANSNLMDLASTEESYRQFSVKETQRVIDLTRKLSDFFPKTNRPLIVANIGGFSMDSPLSKDSKIIRYENFAKSLKELNLSEVELIPQTMAPFPWHFGGQRFQNLFVESEEIIEWSSNLNLRVCLDVSHSALTCNHLGINFYEFCSSVAKSTAHLHIGDAKGINGEGLQIGDGEINFGRLGLILKEKCPRASFIPEIWQGHKNNGSGFWKALENLIGVM